MMRMEERYKAALEQLRGGLISTDLVAVKRYVEVIDEALAPDAPVGKWPTEIIDAMEGRESKPEEHPTPLPVGDSLRELKLERVSNAKKFNRWHYTHDSNADMIEAHAHQVQGALTQTDERIDKLTERTEKIAQRTEKIMQVVYRIAISAGVHMRNLGCHAEANDLQRAIEALKKGAHSTSADHE